MEPLLIALIIIVSILLILGVVLLIIFLKGNKKEEVKIDNTNLEKDLAELSFKLDATISSMKDATRIVILEEVNKLSEKETKSNELNNEKLERFQKNISEALLNRFDALSKQMDEKIAQIDKKVDQKLEEGFKGTSETLIQVRERLQVIDNAQKNIEALSKDVVSLKGVLEGNQTRGMYGEYQLEMVLNKIFGDTIGLYELQYVLKKTINGDVRADAVVFMPKPNNLICIDSKFPFQEYQRMFDAENEEEKDKCKKQFAADVKKHITTIANKYIIENKTAKDAIMFIPNDGIFAFIHHELIDVVDYAREKRVIITSPSTLPAILVTINMVRIEAERSKNIAIISKELNRLGKEFEMFGREWEAFSRQLDLASRNREKLDSRVNKISTRFDAISNSAPTEALEDKTEVIESDEEKS